MKMWKRWDTEKLCERMHMTHKPEGDPEWDRLWKKTWTTMAPFCLTVAHAKRMALEMFESSPNSDPEWWAKMKMGE